MAAVSVLLLVIGSVAALALNSGLNPLGSSDPKPAGTPGGTPTQREETQDPRVASVSPDAPPDPAFALPLRALGNKTDAPIMLPAKLPDELKNVAVDADLEGDSYGILFLAAPPDNLEESFANYKTVAMLRAVPESESQPDQGYSTTSTESVGLPDGTKATLRYMEPVSELTNLLPKWEGAFDKDGYTYTLSTELGQNGKEIVEQALSTMVLVRGQVSGVAEEPSAPSTQPNPDEEALEEFGRDYDEANRGGDWETTYAMLDEESQQQFTEEEWVEKQQDLRDAEGPLSPLQSVSVDLPEGVSDTSGNVILYYQDGTSDTIVAGIPMAVTSEEEAGKPKRTLTEEEISYLEQVSADGDTDDLAAQVEEAAGDYYRAVGVGDFDYTYDALDSETQALFTREEWLQKNQWFAGNGSVIYDIESVYQAGTNDEYFAVTLKLTYEDGSSSTRTTYFVYENGQWLHRFGQEEKDLYGPGVPYEEWVEAKEDGANSYGDTAKGQQEIGRSEAEEAAGDYYRASGSQDWDYTYDALDSETQALFTREEWTEKNQWFFDNAPAIYHIESANMDETAQEPLAEVAVRLTSEDGSSSIRETYFVNEDGEWKHRFAQEEIDLFEPRVPFEEWVDVQ